MADPTSPSVNSEPDNLIQDFSYEALDPEQQEMRLLVISAGKQEEAIVCSLKRVSLEESWEYEALSYAWGEPNFTHRIVLNGATFGITENLCEALKHLRLEDRALVLWVDAICIDQSNVAERSHQVGIMGQIFRCCSRVYVWLGVPVYVPTPTDETPQDGTSGSAGPSRQKPDNIPRRSVEWELNCIAELYSIDPFTLTRHFAANKHFTELPGFLYSETDSKHHFEDNKAFWKLWKSYFFVGQTPWWSRLWCVQEVLLARSVLLVYGTWRISWTDIQLSQVHHRRHIGTCCAGAIKELPHRYRNVREEELIADAQKPDAHERLFSDLDRLLRLYSHRQCKDPRDKVYGILGLTTPGMRSRLAPDYNKDTAEVYADTTRAIYLQRPNSLRFLTGYRMRDPDSKLPSWVRDYAFCQEPWMAWCERHRLDMYEMYSAAGDACAHVDFSGSRIKLKGICVGTVTKVGEVRRTGFVRFKSTVQAWLKMLGWEHPQSTETLQSPQFLKFWRALIADAALEPDRHWRRATDGDVEYCSRAIAPFISSSNPADSQPPDNNILELLVLTTYGKALFSTSEGDLGLCYPRTTPGDELWVLHGSNTPFVLRRVVGESGESVPRFTLIGDAYLDGVMDGEASNKKLGGLCKIFLE